MYDAIGFTIDHIGRRLDQSASKPDKVIIAILTDGKEVHSQKYTQQRVAEMIKHQQEKYSWTFVFLAANQDAFETGAALNISAAHTQNYAATGAGTVQAYASITGTVRSLRGA